MLAAYRCVALGKKTKQNKTTKTQKQSCKESFHKLQPSKLMRKRKIRKEYIHWGKPLTTKIDFFMHLRFCFD